MIRLIAVVFALAIATSAQAMSPAPLHQADGMVTQIRQNCGAGMRWNEALGRCATTSAAAGPPRSGHRRQLTKKPDRALPCGLPIHPNPMTTQIPQEVHMTIRIVITSSLFLAAMLLLPSSMAHGRSNGRLLE